MIRCRLIQNALTLGVACAVAIVGMTNSTVAVASGAQMTAAPASSSSSIAPTAPAISSSVVSGQIADAGTFSNAVLAAKPSLHVTAGGEKGLGVATVNGQNIDVNRLVPTTADTSYVTRLEQANNGKDLLGLKAMYDQEAAADDSRTDVTTDATTTVNNSAANRVYTDKSVANDSTMNSSAAVINNAKGGTIMGDVFAACSSKTVSTPTQGTGTIHNDETCNKVLIPGAGGPACTRTRTGNASYTILPGEKDAVLLVDKGSNATECTRATTVTQYPTTINQADDADLQLTNETGGLSCTRQITASLTTTNTSGSASGDLPINTESGGQSCARVVTVANGSPAYLGLVKVLVSTPGGAQCSVDERDFPVGSSLPSGTQTIGSISFVPTQNTGYSEPRVITPPSAANGWVAALAANCPGGGGGPLGGLAMVGFGTDGHLSPVMFNGWIGYMEFEAYGAPSHTVGVSDSGNCGDPGTGNCPASWTCTANAPTTYNGLTVTVADAQSKSPLFPGAGSSCAKATLNRVCNGSASTSSSISIAPSIPPGTTGDADRAKPLSEKIFEGIIPTAYAASSPGTGFSNFTWSVTNPQHGVTVTLTQTPSAANGWVAGFTVTRTDFSYVPQKPHIVMSWTIATTTVKFGTGDTGNCSDTGSTACPTKWTCTQNAPTTIDGYAISAAQAEVYSPLFPSAPNTCTTGQLSRVCNGSSSIGTTVGIGSLLPAGTTVITNFAWTVTNPTPLVTVALVSAPTYANGWTATFSVTRQYNGGAEPPLPHVHLTWQVAGPNKIVIGYADTGNCNATTADPYCHMAWSCTSNAPQIIDGITVNAPNPSPLYPGGSATCLSGTLAETCSGTGATTTSMSIADQIYPGDTAITGFAWKVTAPVAGVNVSLVQTPAAANQWVAIFQTTRTDWSTPPGNGPGVHLSWNMNGAPQYQFQIVDSGNCSTTGTSFCSVVWKCDENAPVTIDGILVPASVIQGQPSLFSGDGGTCMKAELDYNCTGVWDGQGGQVCWTNDSGQTQCTTVPPSGSPPDTCQDLENNKACILKTSDCADGATDANGFCYVKTYDYDCVTEVQVPDGNTTTVTECTSAQPCLDGTCTPPSRPAETSDRNKSIAQQVIVQTISNDWTWQGAHPTVPAPTPKPQPVQAPGVATQ